MKFEWTPIRAGISSATLIAMLLAIYVGIAHQNERDKIKYIERQIENKEQQLKESNAVPRVGVYVSILSTRMLKHLNSIPTTVEFLHLSGKPAKGLVAQIDSSEPIQNFTKFESMENFTVVRGSDPQQKRLYLYATQLRPTARIGVTVVTVKPSTIHVGLILSEGERIKTYYDKPRYPDYVQETSDEELSSLKAHVAKLRATPIISFGIIAMVLAVVVVAIVHFCSPRTKRPRATRPRRKKPSTKNGKRS